MIYLIAYLLLALVVSVLSVNKRISYYEIFFISLFLTPVMGLITVLKADNNIITHHYTTSNTCSSCGNDGHENDKLCSNCGNEMSYNEESKLKLA